RYSWPVTRNANSPTSRVGKRIRFIFTPLTGRETEVGRSPRSIPGLVLQLSIYEPRRRRKGFWGRALSPEDRPQHRVHVLLRAGEQPARHLPVGQHLAIEFVFHGRVDA